MRKSSGGRGNDGGGRDRSAPPRPVVEDQDEDEKTASGEALQDEGGDAADEPGEGNRKADRRYRDGVERFVAGGNVDRAAEEARRAVDAEGERDELEQAERIGRSRAKEHDPELKRR